MMKILRFNVLTVLCLLLHSYAYAQAPAITGLQPVNEATEVGIQPTLEISFDANMQKGTGAITLKNWDTDVTVESIDVGSSQITINGQTVSIQLSNKLSVESAYYVLIADAALADEAGTAFPGISDKATWSFKTVTAPAAPTDLSISIVSDAEINLTWLDNSHNESGFIILRSTVADFSRDKVEKSVAANTVTFNEQSLNPDETYYYQVSAYNIADTVSSNVVANMTCPPDLQFDFSNNRTVSAQYSTISIGAGMNLYGRIINQADCKPNYASDPVYKVYLSDDQVWDAADLNLSGSTGVQMSDLKEGEFFNLQAVSIPNDAALVGHKYLIIQIDPEQRVYEKDKTNNSYSIPVMISQEAALTIEQLTLIGVNEENGTAEVNFDVVNTGNGPLGAYAIGFYSQTLNSNLMHRLSQAGLAQGERVSLTGVVPISCDNFGTHDLIVRVNDLRSILESEADNTDTVQYTLSGGKPDLHFTSIDGFNILRVNTIDAGQQIEVEANVQNSGADLSSEVELKYYLSADNILDANDVALGSSSITTALGCKQSVALRKMLTIPASTAVGPYQILAMIDPNAGLPELRKDNNFIYSSSLVVSNQPDLVVENVVISNEPNSLGELSINFDVRNLGNGPVNSSAINVYLSDDNQFDLLTDARIDVEYRIDIPSLAAGGLFSSSVSYPLESCSAVGDKFLFVKADGIQQWSGAAEGVIPESNEENNLSTATAVHITDIPDLELFVTSNESSSSDQEILASVRIKNNAGTAKAASSLKFYLSNNERVGSADPVLSTISIPELACNASYTITDEILTLPADLADGKYIIIAVADADKGITEVEENNNSDFFTFNKFTVEPEPEPEEPVEPSCTPPTPTGLTTNNITENSATLNWNSVSSATAYRLWVSGIGTINTNSSANTYTLTGLPAGTKVTWTVLSLCSGGASSAWAEASSFTTTGENQCIDPTGLIADNITEISATLRWDEVSGATAYRLWVSGIGTINTNSSANTYTLTGLPAGTKVTWTVLSLCSGGASSAWAEASSFTTTGENQCIAPTGLIADNITENSATLRWDEISGATAYRLWVRGIGTINTNSSANTYTLTGLPAGTKVTWTVLSLCSGGASSAWAEASSFTTTGENQCIAPTGLIADNITENSATLRWDEVSGATAYRLWVSGIGTINTNSSANTYTLTGLPAGTKVTWTVLSLCSGGASSAWAEASSFTTSRTSANNTQSRLYFSQDISKDAEQLNLKQLTLYPNPSDDKVNISLTGNENITAIYVMNTQGVIVKRLEGISSNYKTLQLKNYGAGLYIIKILINNEYAITKKAVIR